MKKSLVLIVISLFLFNPINFIPIEPCLANFLSESDSNNLDAQEMELSFFTKTYEENLIINVPEISFKDIKSTTYISIEGYGSTTDNYKPGLPTKTFYYMLPSNAENVSVSLNQIDLETYNNVENIYETNPPMPANNDPEYIPPPRIQDYKTYFPDSYFRYNGIKNLNDYKLVSITVFPVRYYFNSKKIEYLKEYEFVISYNLDGFTKKYPNKSGSPIEELASDIILNYDDKKNEIQTNFTRASNAFPLSSTNTKYAIITTSSFEEYLIPLKEWKTKKGIPTEIYLTSDIYSDYSGIDNAEKIRNFLINLESNDDIDWVLLAGDVEEVPTRFAYCNDDYEGDGDYVPTDYYYADLEGNYIPYDWDKDDDGRFGEYNDNIDWLPEVYVGRLSTSSTSKMQTLVDRIINYEKNPESGAWKNKVILAGAKSDGSTDESLLMEYIKDDFLSGNMNYERLYYLDNYERDYKLSFSNFENRVGTGACLVNWAGHGSYTSAVVELGESEFVSTSTNPSNNNMRPLVYADSCYTGAYDQETSLGEYILCNWGIGFVGSSRVSWYIIGWPGPSYGYNQAHDYNFFKQIFINEKYQPGKVLYDSKVDYLNDYTSNFYPRSLEEMKNLFDYNLLGDPEIHIWTDTPANFDVTYPSTLTTGSSSFTIHVEDDGLDVEDAYVCISKADEVYLTGYSDSNGEIDLTPNLSTFGTMNITVTKHNYIPYEGETQVVDNYESDNSYTEASYIETDNTLQLHNFHDSGDQDWVKLNGLINYTYEIKTTGLGSNCDTELYLFDTDGTTLIDYDNNSGSEQYSSLIEWACPNNGLYYVMGKHWDASIYGSKTNYNLSISINNYPPIADFLYTPSAPNTEDIIDFTDNSIDNDNNLNNWSWNFGDGNISFEQNPTHRYTDDGTYTVRLIVTDEYSIPDTKSIELVILNSPPVSNFTYTPLNPTDIQTIIFEDSSTDYDGIIVNYTWDFGDGCISFEQNPSHQYADNRNYDVSLTITDDDDDTDVKTKMVAVRNIPPISNFSVEPSSFTTQDSIYFNDTSTDIDGSIVNWTWDFGDEEVAYTRNTTHRYSDDGVYTVNLTVTDDDASVDYYNEEITVNNSPPNANFTTHPSFPTILDIVSFNDSSIDMDGSIVNWSWDFGDGSDKCESRNISHQYLTSGSYQVNLTVKDNDGVNATEERTLVVKKPATVYVDDDFNNYTTGWQINYFNNLQDGVDGVAEFGDIYVYNGTYYGNVDINKTITINGENKNTTILDGNNSEIVITLSENKINISNLTFQNSGSGFYTSGLFIHTSFNHTIKNNIFRNCDNGIFFFYTLDNCIHNNIFEECTNGMTIYYSSAENFIYKNTFRNNSKGINIISGLGDPPSNNHIYHNNFISNTLNAYDEGSNNWDEGNNYGGNYWDDYTDVDNNTDGFGNVAYNISGGSNKDNYPLILNFENYYIISLEVNSEVNEKTDFTVIVVTIYGIELSDVTITFNSEAKTSDENGKVTFTSPSVQSNTDYEIIASKTGYISNSTIIEIKNVASRNNGGGDIGIVVENPKNDVNTSSSDKPNELPDANAGGPYNGTLNQSIAFDGSASIDTNGSIISYHWDFGDGEVGFGQKINHNYSSIGNYTIILTVTDDSNDTDTDVTSVFIFDNKSIDNDSTVPVNCKITIDEEDVELIDKDNDGFFDNAWKFDSNEKIIVKSIGDNNYLIDMDGDGNWDYVYNSSQGSVSPFSSKYEQGQKNFFFYLFKTIIILIVFAIFVIFLRRKKIYSDNVKVKHKSYNTNKNCLNDFHNSLVYDIKPEKYQLMKIIYPSYNVKIKNLLNKINLPEDQIEVMVSELISEGLLKHGSDDKIKLTKKGIRFFKLKD